MLRKIFIAIRGEIACRVIPNAPRIADEDLRALGYNRASLDEAAE